MFGSNGFLEFEQVFDCENIILLLNLTRVNSRESVNSESKIGMKLEILNKLNASKFSVKYVWNKPYSNAESIQHLNKKYNKIALYPEIIIIWKLY